MKVAVCLSGHTRCYQDIDPRVDCFSSCENIEIDYFVSTHRQDGVSKIHQDGLPIGFHYYGHAQTKDTDINALTECFSPKMMEVSDDQFIEDPIFQKFNNARNYHGLVIHQVVNMFYKIYRANLLKKQYEDKMNFKYDLVIRHRFDAKLTAVKIQGFDKKLLIKKHKIHPRGFHDLLFMGASEVMDTASGCFSWLMSKDIDFFQEYECAEYIFEDYIKEVFKEKNVLFSEDFFFTFFSAREGMIHL